MEEKKTVKSHAISWRDRMTGSVTGVKDVISFDEHCVVLETEQGMLTIKGRELHVGRLTLDQGEVEIGGIPDSMVYSGSIPANKGKLLRRMFQ